MKLLSLLAGAVLSAAVLASGASAASTAVSPYGIDVSWPQCGKSVPRGAAYIIVGVNDGNANSTNKCLADQLSAANIALGNNTRALQYYVNTGNPGFKGSGKSGAWPSSNTYRGQRIDVPDTLSGGTCKGKENYNNVACAYVYGWSRAYDDAQLRGVPDPALHMWWLDVEEINSWNYDNPAANRAVLEGMYDYFSRQLGAKVGVYTVDKMWRDIVGDTLPKDSPLRGLPVWYPMCKVSQEFAAVGYHLLPSPTGGDIVMVQYIKNGVDYNYSEAFTPVNANPLIEKVLTLFAL